MGDQERIKLTDEELLYAATERCRCGAGLAYPRKHELAMAISAWICSAVLKGDGVAHDQSLASFGKTAPPGEHDSLPFAFYKVREETSINNRGGHTTRPAGTLARTVGTAKCPTCKHEWISEPYDANGQGHHWFSGPCPECGHAVGGDGVYRSGDGPRIETRHRVVVLAQATPTP